MKCSKCGAEIKSGSVYCDSCGEAVQMVPDYNLLEDDFLVSILEEKKQEDARHAADIAQEEQPSEAPKKGFAALWSNKKTRMALIGGLVAVAALIIGLVFYLTSYAHYVSKGKSYDAKDAYEAAVTYYEKAIAKNDTKVQAKILAADDYIRLADYDRAEELLLQVIVNEPDNIDAYRSLILLYQTTEDYDALTYLQDSVTDPAIIALFEESLVTPPVFSESAGSFNDDISLELSCDVGTIYYTLDGSDPSKEDNGIRYQEPILLTEGTTTVKAVCQDGDKYSQVLSQKYKITYQTPDYPEVSPMDGSFTMPTTITINVPEGCEVYYTWDGSKPTTASTRYTGPIDVIEGNNILSVILVDKHGKTSDVLQCNYKYIPE